MLSFRTAAPVDAPMIADLVNSGYRGESSKRGWTTEAALLGGQRTDPGKILEMIQAQDSRVELALLDAAALGCVHLKKEDARTCYLGMLTVEPGRQARGLGKQILAHGEGIARRWGCTRLRMTVIDRREELLQYYERRGYRRTGAVEAFPEGDPRFGLPKVKGLMFLELEKKI